MRNFPILLNKKSTLAKLIIMEYHEKMAHAGCYSVLSEMRKKFWIPHYFPQSKIILNLALSVVDLMSVL